MSESETIAKYQPVIRALLPYANDGRLLEGLNKFTGRLSTSVRKVLKAEVERLMSNALDGADNSKFAVFATRDFKHFGYDMRLDEIGEDILRRETQRYFDKYTVGVLESITSSDHYQHRLKQENHRRIVEHFAVDSSSLTDIPLDDSLSLQWAEFVEVECNNKLEKYKVVAVSKTGLTIQSRRVTGIKKGNSVKVHVDKRSPLAIKGTTLLCESGVSNFNKESKFHEVVLSFSKATLDSISAPLKALLLEMADDHLLTAKLELERTTQIIERDMMLNLSPWIPMFISEDGTEAKVLVTKQNMSLNKNIALTQDIPSMRVINRIVREIEFKDEVFLLRGKVQHNNTLIDISATLSQLLNANLLETFLYHSRCAGHLSITQIRAKTINHAVIDKILNGKKEDMGHISSLSSILFVRDVTEHVIKVSPENYENLRSLPKQLIDNDARIQTKFYLQESLNRRAEHRYFIKKPIKITASLLKKFDGELIDLSLSGMRIRTPLNCVNDIGQHIKIDIKSLGLSGIKYKVVDKCRKSGILRLCLSGTTKTKREAQDTIKSLIDNNASFFAKRNKSLAEQEEFGVLWDIAARYQPSLGVACIRHKNPNERMKSVYAEESPRDAGPFRGDGKRLYMHGIFADTDSDVPQSSLLAGMVNNTETQRTIIHCRHRKKKNIVPISDEQFYKVGREALRTMSVKRKADLFVCDVQCFKNEAAGSTTIHQRLEWVKKQDAQLGRTLRDAMKKHTHFIFCTDISLLHNAMLILNVTDDERADANKTTVQEEREASVA